MLSFHLPLFSFSALNIGAISCQKLYGQERENSYHALKKESDRQADPSIWRLAASLDIQFLVHKHLMFISGSGKILSFCSNRYRCFQKKYQNLVLVLEFCPKRKRKITLVKYIYKNNCQLIQRKFVSIGFFYVIVSCPWKLGKFETVLNRSTNKYFLTEKGMFTWNNYH